MGICRDNDFNVSFVWESGGKCNTELSESKLNNRYNYASVVHGVNYKRTFIDLSWEEFQEKLAWLLLSNLFAIYEGWLAELKEDCFPNMDIKNMQFPTVGTTKGIYNEINKFTASSSPLTSACFYAKYSSKRHYSAVLLDNLVYCYRYFKELRNCYIHNGIKVSQKLCDTYLAFLTYHSDTALGIKESLEIHSPILGDSCSVSLRGVIGFSEIILNMMVTCDAELSKAKEGEDYLLKQLKQVHTQLRCLNGDPEKAKKQAGRFCVKAGFVMPDDLETMKQYLLDNNIVSL